MNTRVNKKQENLDVRKYLHEVLEHYMNEYIEVEQHDIVNRKALLDKCTTLTDACLILSDYYDIISKGGE